MTFQFPIAIVTVWHPEDFLGLQQSDLHELPWLKKDRREEERNKAELARQKGITATTDIMHHRPIINFGKPKYWFRQTWLDGDRLVGILGDYPMRLINTEETGPQPIARFKIEARPNWGAEPHGLPRDLVGKIQDALSKCKVSVRQLWINPFTRDTSDLPTGPFYNLNATANVVIGPYDEPNCLRRARLAFYKHPDAVSIHQHSPSYTSTLITENPRVLEDCSLWFVEYDEPRR